MKLSLAQLGEFCGGRVLGNPASLVSSVSHDTRKLAAGALYVALPGARVDGHALLAQAQAAGACAALVDHQVDAPLAQIVVADVTLALSAIARRWLVMQPATRIALTGSCGKTSVKQICATILAQIAPTYATHGNLNNQIGLPLSALSVREQHRYAVLELGAGKPGDIAYLAHTAQPHVALVNNVMPAHLERLGSVRAVADEKAQIYVGLSATGTAVINADDAYADLFRRSAGAARLLEFALEVPAAIRASAIKLGAHCAFTLHTPFGNREVELPLAGLHNVRNALAATGACLAAGATLEQVVSGLALVHACDGRLQLSQQADGWSLIDDSYNANPGSFKAGIDALRTLGGEAWVVMGDMAELGPESPALHREVGAHALQAGIKRLLAVGAKSADAALAAGAIGEHFPDLQSLVGTLQRELRPGVMLLVKGSRSSGMERVVQALTNRVAVH